MEEEILKLIEKHDCEIPIKSSIMAEPDMEEWLWSGDYKDVSKEITSMVMEFAVWFAADSFEIVESGIDEDGNNIFNDLDGNIITPNDIFDYWNNNIRKP